MILLLAVLLSLAGCTNQGKDKKTEEKVSEKNTVVKVALTGEKSDVWEYVKEQVAKEGIDLELMFFSDYIIPNTALADGEVDINAFQTQIFFENYVKESGADLSILGYTSLAPMGIYEGKISRVEDLQQGDKISIPNDVTNGGRALILLQAAGIIQVDPKAGLTPTLKDVIENPLEIKIVELAAPQIPTTLDEVALGVINNGIAVTAGYAPLEDAIFIENSENEGIENYYNIIAVQTSRKEEEAIQKVLKAYQTDETKKIIDETYNGSSIPVF
ncbi:MAG: MetQ/NlpA family ABC transporter substrate-binding protein [Clostridiales bacterium]|nr:MetQ/NlpA family ABC transporter substrate-binding protein [Clostridiales bacterium]